MRINLSKNIQNSRSPWWNMLLLGVFGTMIGILAGTQKMVYRVDETMKPDKTVASQAKGHHFFRCLPYPIGSPQVNSFSGQETDQPVDPQRMATADPGKLAAKAMLASAEQSLSQTNDELTWSQKRLGQSPPARRYHALAYDTAREQVLLFGGIMTAVPI